MNETKETTQDAPEKDTSGGAEGTTSPEVKTFKEEEVQKLINDALAQKGRDAKALAEREAAIKAQEDANKAMGVEIERQRLEAQRKALENVADDPEAKKALLHQYDMEKREREIEEMRQKNESAVRQMFSEAEALAIEYELKPSDLLSAGNPEAMKLLAKNLALERQLAEKGKGSSEKEKKEGFVADSGKSDGATSDFKTLEKNFIADPYKYGLAYKKALAERGQ